MSQAVQGKIVAVVNVTFEDEEIMLPCELQ